MPIRPVSMMFCRPNARLLPARSGSRTVRSFSTRTKPGSSPFGDTSIGPSRPAVAISANGHVLQEVDRLFVEIGGHLGLGGLPWFGENVSQLLDGFDLAHDRISQVLVQRQRNTVPAEPSTSSCHRCGQSVPRRAAEVRIVQPTKKPAVICDGRLLSVRRISPAALTLRNAYRNLESETALDRALGQMTSAVT